MPISMPRTEIVAGVFRDMACFSSLAHARGLFEIIFSCPDRDHAEAKRRTTNEQDREIRLPLGTD